MNDKSRKLFEYLLAINNLRFKAIREYKEYEKSWTKNALEEYGEGIYVKGEGEDEESILEIHRQRITDDILIPPAPNKLIEEWITDPYNNENKPPKIPASKIFVKGTEEVEVRFEEDKERMGIFHQWKADWGEWAAEINRIKKVQNLYETFFKIHQDFQTEGEGIELLLGETIFTWKHEVGNINHPLFTTKLDVELDTEKGIIIVKPTNQGYKLELNILSGIALPNMEEIQKIGRVARYRDVIEEDVKDLSSQFMQLVDASGRTASTGEEMLPTKNAVAHIDEYILILRRKDNQVIKNDLEQILEAMQQDDFEVPATIDSIVGNDVKINEQENDLNWGKVASDLYFPLAANEEQKEIARRLASNYGITVQGPPGTGKTHTIANLVSHLLAHGKKILITSQKENPLKVLKDKIPEEIRDLCVPVLGGGRDSLREIEKSIRTISEKLGNVSTEKLASEIDYFKTELDQSKRKEAKFKHQLLEYSKSEKTEIEFKGQTVTKADIAEMLNNETIDYHWILDKVELNSTPPIRTKEFEELWKLRGILKKEELVLADFVLPKMSSIKSPEQMTNWLMEGKSLKNKYDTYISDIEKLDFPHEVEYAKQLQTELTTILEYKDCFETGSALYMIVDDYLAGGTRKERWLSFFSDIKLRNEEIIALHNTIINYDIHLPNKPDFELEGDIYVYGERLRQQKKPSMIFGLTKGKRAKYLWETPIINGQPVRSVEEIDLLQQYLLLKKKREEVVRIWNANLQEINGESINAEDKRIFSTIDKEIEVYEKAMTLGSVIERLQQTSNRLTLHHVNWLDEFFYKALMEAVEHVFSVLEYESWEQEYQRYVDELKLIQGQEKIHPIGQRFLEVLLLKDETKWSSVIEELQLTMNKKEEVDRFYELYNPLSKVAPNTGISVMNLLSRDSSIPKEVEKSWELKSLYDWMIENQGFEAERIEGSIKDEQDYQKKLIIQIVSHSTWMNQINRITDTQKRALVAWKNFIKRYGKGTGNNKRYLVDARKEMEKAQSAIPVWIMPVNQVIENFSTYNEKFDVIIFDESSQCDIMSIPVLLRGEKIVVVGDDEQISPYGIGTKDSDIEELIQRYLDGVPNKRLFDHKISLYEIADQIFPKSGRLMLKEHFRCVPEIIQFSNDLSYGGQMIPLRLPFEDEKLDPPVMAVKVEEGYATEGKEILNYPEADKIVEDIKEILANPQYKDQTIGVITLQGHKQAALIENKIREQISESEFVKRKIICGNAYSLQGDERDIIFLSMVIANNRRFNSLTKKEYQQTFNVAASRARNQMRLYHSIELDDLSKQDYRYSLLSYCKNPTRVNEVVENLEEKCDSPFEVEVLRMIVAKGYRVQPQVQVGKYRIDLVVEGIRERLAVECDGERWHGPEKWEEDMQRQYDLERAGWKFWRIRGREFYFNKTKSMERLWEKLDELGIKN